MKIFESKRLIFSILSVVLVGGFIFYAINGTPWDRYKYKKKFEAFIEEEHQKDFVIANISFDVFHNTYHSNAHEKGQPELSFYVGQMHNKEITDGYTSAKTGEEAVEKVGAILDKHVPKRIKASIDLIGENRELEVNIRTEQELDAELKEKIKKEIIANGFKPDQLYFHVGTDE